MRAAMPKGGSPRRHWPLLLVVVLLAGAPGAPTGEALEHSVPASSCPTSNTTGHPSQGNGGGSDSSSGGGDRPSACRSLRSSLPYGGRPCSRGACLPSFLIIGAGKCGTSSLYYYLVDHPQVHAARAKQVQFFDHQLARGLQWYTSNFPKDLPDDHVTGEASPG